MFLSQIFASRHPKGGVVTIQSNTSVAIYSRKSRYTGKGESIGNQVDLCLAYIQTSYGKNFADNALIFEDEGFSGGNLNRPDFKRMMKAAHEKKFNTLVVYRLDRISRNIGDFSHLIEELSQLQISFVSIRENFDTTSPMGRAMMYIASVFSQLERETIAERIRDNMHELAKTGRWLGGNPPTGYISESIKSITVNGKSKRSCKLKLLPEQAQTVQQIYTLYLQFHSLSKTEQALMQLCIQTKNGCNFSRFSIKAILQNPVYLIADQAAYRYFKDNNAELFSDAADFDGVHGILAYNRTLQQKGHSTIYLPIEDWIISVGQHPGIISSSRWIRTQSLLEQNKSNIGHASKKDPALLSGLLFCACGSPMYSKKSSRILSNGSTAFYYICKEKAQSKQQLCHTRNVNGNELDLAVLQEIQSLCPDPAYFTQLLQKSKTHYLHAQKQTNHPLKTLYKQRESLIEKINALIDSLSSFENSSAFSCLKNRIEELYGRLDQLNLQIHSLESSMPKNFLSFPDFDQLRKLLSSFESCINLMPPLQQHTVVQSLLKTVIWNGSNAHLFYNSVLSPLPQ